MPNVSAEAPRTRLKRRVNRIGRSHTWHRRRHNWPRGPVPQYPPDLPYLRSQWEQAVLRS